jgi:hypothetical protein
MELKPPKFEQEIKKITTLQNTFWLELKNLGTSYLSLYLYGYGVGKFLEHGIK